MELKMKSVALASETEIRVFHTNNFDDSLYKLKRKILFNTQFSTADMRLAKSLAKTLDKSLKTTKEKYKRERIVKRTKRNGLIFCKFCKSVFDTRDIIYHKKSGQLCPECRVGNLFHNSRGIKCLPQPGGQLYPGRVQIYGLLNPAPKKVRKKPKKTEVKQMRLASMLTMTYDEDHYGGCKPSEEIRKFLNRMKTYYRKDKKRNPDKYENFPSIEYVWRVERGAEKGRLHIHILLNILDGNWLNVEYRGFSTDERLNGWWQKGGINPESLIHDEDGRPLSNKKAQIKVAVYVSKYCSKLENKDPNAVNFPGRMWSASRGFTSPTNKIFLKFVPELKEWQIDFLKTYLGTEELRFHKAWKLYSWTDVEVFEHELQRDAEDLQKELKGRFLGQTLERLPTETPEQFQKKMELLAIKKSKKKT